MMAYLLIFLAGAAGSFHCVGMCGGFACAIGKDPRGGDASLRRHLNYNAGRLMTYCFIGAVAGYAGSILSDYYHIGANSLTISQRLLALASGMLMLWMGLQFFGFFKRSGYHTTVPGGLSIVPAARGLLREPGLAATLAFGVFNGFLPCPLVYAFTAQAAASGGPLGGMMVMIAFGLGTFPAMLLMGALGTRISMSSRLRGVRFAGAFIIFLGLITLARGLDWPGEHGHMLLDGLAPNAPAVWPRQH